MERRGVRSVLEFLSLLQMMEIIIGLNVVECILLGYVLTMRRKE